MYIKKYNNNFGFFIFPKNGVSTQSIMNKFELKGSSFIINKSSTLNILQPYIGKDYIYSNEAEPRLITLEIFNEIKEYFFNQEKEIQFQEEQKIKQVMKKIIFSSVNDLEEGNTIVFRDRENPNMIGKVSIKNNKVFINNMEYNGFFTHKDIRIVKNGDKFQEYFLNEDIGIDLYKRSSSYSSYTPPIF